MEFPDPQTAQTIMVSPKNDLDDFSVPLFWAH